MSESLCPTDTTVVSVRFQPCEAELLYADGTNNPHDADCQIISFSVDTLPLYVVLGCTMQVRLNPEVEKLLSELVELFAKSPIVSPLRSVPSMTEAANQVLAKSLPELIDATKVINKKKTP